MFTKQTFFHKGTQRKKEFVFSPQISFLIHWNQIDSAILWGQIPFPVCWQHLLATFTIRVSCRSILHVVAQHCGLPYISDIHQILDDGSHIYGIELELPTLFCHGRPQKHFFWSNSAMESSAAYEMAALQALTCLQTINGFIIVDYSLHDLVLYRALSQRLLPIANRGVQLATLILTAPEHESQHHSELPMKWII